MATNLTEIIANAVVEARTRPPDAKDGDQIPVALDLLDDNPYQPRSSMDSAELAELVASIRSEGLIQAITVRPTPNGRYTIVAGHRRVAAWRQLLASATTDDEKKRYATIPSRLKFALDNAHLAAQAYIENVTRSALTALEEAEAINRMFTDGLATTTEELAALINQPARRVARLRKLLQAPPVVRQATSTGLQVVVGRDADGGDIKELRRLDLFDALAYQRLFEHFLTKTKSAKVATTRTEKAVRRALAGNWSSKRNETFVQAVIEGKAKVSDASEDGVTPDATEAALYVSTPARFSFDPRKLKAASTAQLTDLRAAFEALLTPSAPPNADIG